jgi:glutamate-5-semialdehyde dehydrogenase
VSTAAASDTESANAPSNSTDTDSNSTEPLAEKAGNGPSGSDVPAAGEGSDGGTDSGTGDDSLREQVREAARRARVASRVLGLARRADKDRALGLMADALLANTEAILAANAEDVRIGTESGMAVGLVDRLTLT